jgi:hypothetical protein
MVANIPLGPKHPAVTHNHNHNHNHNHSCHHSHTATQSHSHTGCQGYTGTTATVPAPTATHSFDVAARSDFRARASTSTMSSKNCTSTTAMKYSRRRCIRKAGRPRAAWATCLDESWRLAGLEVGKSHPDQPHIPQKATTDAICIPPPIPPASPRCPRRKPPFLESLHDAAAVVLVNFQKMKWGYSK